MRLILVGAGRLSRQLLRRLGERWVVTVVDPVEDHLARAREVRSVRCIVGDASSRIVLKKAGLEGADALIAASNDDAVNLEVCRLAADAGIRRRVAVANDPDRAEAFREIGVSAFSPHLLAARRMELQLETRRVASMAFADGRAEAMEFRVAEDSPVCGKALKDLHARSWIVGAILRDNGLVVPHGETVLETGDLVTVVGDGAAFTEMVRTFTAGEGRFPLSFGKRVALAVESPADVNGLLSEATQLVRNTRASSLLLVYRDPAAITEPTQAERIHALLQDASVNSHGVDVRRRPVDGKPADALSWVPGVESVGVIVIPARQKGRVWSWLCGLRASGLVRWSGRPVLIARGSHPYRRILVPARRTPAGRAAVRVAIDLAHFAKAELHGLAVVDPVFISGPEAPLDARRAIAWLEEEAAVQGVSVRGVIRRGNPARILREVGEEADLLVLGVSGKRRSWSWRPRAIGDFVARRTGKSVLLVPV